MGEVDIYYYVDAAYDAIVRKGAKALAKVKPEWFLNTSIDRLDLASETACVLGQNFSIYYIGKNELGIVQEEAVALGFDVPEFGVMGLTKSESYSRLTEAWVRRIKKLRKKHNKF